MKKTFGEIYLTRILPIIVVLCAISLFFQLKNDFISGVMALLLILLIACACLFWLLGNIK